MRLLQLQSLATAPDPGIKCAVIEKNVEFTRHPRAHFINNRTMEIFRKLDGLARDIERSQPPVDLWRKFVYCTSLSGSVLGSVDHMKQEGQFSSYHVECFMSCTSLCMSSDKYF